MNISSNHLKSCLGIRFLLFSFLIGYSFLTLDNIAMAESMIDRDRVIRIDDKNMLEPIGIHFADHAAIYFLKRDDPHFSSFLSVLRKSQAEKTLVRFRFNVYGQLLTFVEADHL